MTLLSGSSEADIDASAQRCWAVIEDVARWPQWQRGLESVEVVQRDAQGRAIVCDTVSDAKFTKVRARVAVTYDAPRRLEFSRLESERRR